MIVIAFDTNILAYMSGIDRHPDDAAKIALAQSLVADVKGLRRLVYPAQALGELFRLIIRSGDSAMAAAEQVRLLSADVIVAPTLVSTFNAALDLAGRHRLQIWDAIIVSAAVEAGAHWLLSEDMHDGFVWRGLTIVNPLAIDRATLLERLLP